MAHYTDYMIAMAQAAAASKPEESAHKDHSSLNTFVVEPSADEEQALVTSKVDLMRSFPFLGYMVAPSEYIFVHPEAMPTLAATTIPQNIVYINGEYFLSLTRQERAFAIGHEILHIYFEHIGRQLEMTYHPKLWNIATDFAINCMLVNMGNPMVKISPNWLYDSRWDDMSADEIYHKILEENDDDADKAVAVYGEGEGQGKNGQGPMDQVSSEAQGDQSKSENRQAMGAAANDLEGDKSMGHGAAGMLRHMKDMLDSKIPWKVLLRDFVVDVAKSRYTYNRISRRSSASVIFPSMTGEHIKLLFGVDTSGSMSDTDLAEALAELRQIIDDFDSWSLDLISCDTNAEHIGTYESEEGDDFDNVNKQLVGGGGTDMAPMVDYCEDMDEQPSVAIIITDGYIPEQSLELSADNTDVPVIVVVTTNGNYDLKLQNCLVLQMKDV